MNCKQTIRTAFRWIGPVSVALCTLISIGAHAEEWTNGQGVLWKVEYGGKPPSHILGTMHSADERVLDLPYPARVAFEAADVLALELALASPQAGHRARVALFQDLVLTDGRTLDQIIGEQWFEQVADVLERNDIPRHIARVITPSAAYQLMHIPEPIVDDEGHPVPPLDMRLELDAREAGKRIVALEHLKEQSDLFVGGDEETDIQILLSLVKLAERHGGLNEYFTAKMEMLIELYEAQDIAAILEVSYPPMPPAQARQAAKFINKLLFRRNARMVQRMDVLLTKGNAFIAIGAAHLPGRKGIINMLSQRGYKVSRVQ